MEKDSGIFSTPIQKKKKNDFSSLNLSQQFSTANFTTPASNSKQDRFIPKRNTPLSNQLFSLPSFLTASPQDISKYSEQEQNFLIKQNLLQQKILSIENFDYINNQKGQQKILHFSNKKENKISINFNEEKSFSEIPIIKNIQRCNKISKKPFKILDAPGLIDNYYMNVLDWSKQNQIGISLMNEVFLFRNSSKEGQIKKIAEVNNPYCSIKFCTEGNFLSCGNDQGLICIYDTSNGKVIKKLRNQKQRISVMDWQSPFVLSTGSRDRTVRMYDLRIGKEILHRQKHQDEICGLKWDHRKNYLASGGNDNNIFIWDQRSTHTLQSFKEHQAAVRALVWNPHNYGTLVSGGGNNDKCIKFWNINQTNSLQTIKTESQICSLAYSTHCNEFVSAHGFSGNQIMVWDGDTKERVSVLEGHQQRVLHMALSPDDQTIATAASDETLKFWTVFPKMKEPTNKITSFVHELRQIILIIQAKHSQIHSDSIVNTHMSLCQGFSS